MSKKKKIINALIALLSAGTVLAAILLGVHFGTLNDINGYDYFNDTYEIPFTYISEEAQVTADRTDSYLGHPDLLKLNDGTLVTMYPLSHGKGQLAMKTSTDDGKSWSERISNIPASWANSQETPTLYRLDFQNGEIKYLMVSGCPYWGIKIKENGFNCSLSSDGLQWSEFENFYGRDWAKANGKRPFDCIVAMSSLTRIMENGKFIDKWMGTFHNRKYVNYKTYLTFDDEGNMVWSEPEKLLPEWRKIERKTGMCELEIIRTPSADGTTLSGDTLILLARANKRRTNSMIAFSNDEGATWTQPKELPNCLTGDRHKAEYDPVSKKLAISFRSPQIKLRISAIAPVKSYYTLGWVAWVGDFSDLLSLRDDNAENNTYGDRVLVLGTDYSYSADCGYAGTAIARDGYFTMISYGRFAEDANNPYIMSVRFRLDSDGNLIDEAQEQQ